MQARIDQSIETITKGGLLTLQPIVFHEDPAIAGAYWDARKALIPMVGAVREAGTSVLLEDVAGTAPPLHTYRGCTMHVGSAVSCALQMGMENTVCLCIAICHIHRT